MAIEGVIHTKIYGFFHQVKCCTTWQPLQCSTVWVISFLLKFKTHDYIIRSFVHSLIPFNRSWWRCATPLHRTHRRYNDVSRPYSSVCFDCAPRPPCQAQWHGAADCYLLAIVSDRHQRKHLQICKLNLHSHFCDCNNNKLRLHFCLFCFDCIPTHTQPTIEWTFIHHVNWLHQVNELVPIERVKRMFAFGVRIHCKHCMFLEWVN